MTESLRDVAMHRLSEFQAPPHLIKDAVYRHITEDEKYYKGMGIEFEDLINTIKQNILWMYISDLKQEIKKSKEIKHKDYAGEGCSWVTIIGE